MQRLARTRFSNVTFDGFSVNVNGTDQPAVPFVLTPLVVSSNLLMGDEPPTEGAARPETSVSFGDGRRGQRVEATTRHDRRTRREAGHTDGDRSLVEKRWVVLFENAGASAGTFVLHHLDSGLSANATKWSLSPASGPVAIAVSGSAQGGCGTIAVEGAPPPSEGATDGTFCVR